MKHTDYEAYLLQRQRRADEWTKTIGKKHGLLPVSNQNLIKASSGSCIDNLENIPHTASFVSPSVDRQWVLDCVLACVTGLRGISQVEAMMYSTVIVDSLDFFREKKSSFGLCDLPSCKQDLIAYEDIYDLQFNHDLFQQFRNHIKNACAIFGLGVASTDEYHALLLQAPINRSVYSSNIVLRAKAVLSQIKYHGSEFAPELLPSGPLDEEFFLLN